MKSSKLPLRPELKQKLLWAKFRQKFMKRERNLSERYEHVILGSFLWKDLILIVFGSLTDESGAKTLFDVRCRYAACLGRKRQPLGGFVLRVVCIVSQQLFFTPTYSPTPLTPHFRAGYVLIGAT